jgi:ribosomal protein S18 acetylase RimI-like enzyme
MITVESRHLSQTECQRLAELTLSARKGTPIETGKTLKETTASIEQLSANTDFQILIAQDDRGAIVGWTYDYVGFPLMTFISGFFPLIDPTHDSEAIALALIEAEKRKIGEFGHNRLEIELELPTKDHREHSERLVTWYRKCGFQFAAEEVHMTSDLNAITLPPLDPPKDCTLRRFSEYSFEQLEVPGFRVFENSRDDLFLSMSPAEQKVTLEHFFDHSNPLIDEASLILEQHDKIIGFVITKKKEEADIGPIGVVPEARGQGLGTYLLVTALRAIKECGMNVAGLDMSINNEPARKLYQRYGFKDAYYKQFYYWSPKMKLEPRVKG